MFALLVYCWLLSVRVLLGGSTLCFTLLRIVWFAQCLLVDYVLIDFDVCWGVVFVDWCGICACRLVSLNLSCVFCCIV